MKSMIRPFLLCVALLLTLCSLSSRAAVNNPPTSGPTIPGNRAALKGRIAYAPENAPECVKRAIWATNYLTSKPYVWGGGHGSIYDQRGYDCSGTVSFFLYHGGLVSGPTTSSEYVNYGQCGKGKWVTVYARNGHVFAVIAGLRLDTTGFRQEDGPRWRLDGRTAFGFVARHPAGI
jgi:hypothetical protein